MLSKRFDFVKFLQNRTAYFFVMIFTKQNGKTACPINN
ncbi:hypothetical protein CYK57_00009 [Actinobacillus pleuropneumoniae]|nr:hypothetical protein appser12_350 [Actinobacillus pleuropneumoniae serovar 12 str. 1096]QSZ37893.1 hypothetical protein CYK57_00009 [Actinobacillus pleuropneumoniae]